ncbi:hypothetical protein SHIRM173S_00610 [Streptomyces hirsutus]
MLKRCETPGMSSAYSWVYLSSTSGPMTLWTSSLFRTTLSIPERVFSRGPTRRPTWASVTACLPLLVTVPDTVTVSSSPGTLGVSEFTETETEPVPETACAELPTAAAGDTAGHWSSPVSRGTPANRVPVRRSQRRAGEGCVPWKSAASATCSPVPRRQWSSYVRPRMVTMPGEAECRGPVHKIGSAAALSRMWPYKGALSVSRAPILCGDCGRGPGRSMEELPVARATYPFLLCRTPTNKPVP